MSKWIWKFGDMEIYHNLFLHNRRTQYGYPEPPVWKMYTPESAVSFRKKVTTEGGTFRVKACGNFCVMTGMSFMDRVEHGGKEEITLPAGTTMVEIHVSNYHTFPCIYVDGVIESDESWEVDDLSHHFEPVGWNPLFTDREHTPEVFPFAYEKIEVCSREACNGGVLFDFGKETFAKLSISGLLEEKVKICLGESKEEALDPVWSYVRFEENPKEGKVELPASAFRYVWVSEDTAEAEGYYEYLPLAYKGSFHSGEEVINKVWDVAAYTFHLNSREFFLDGIKRDRWVWSADAYQSLFVSRYLFYDANIERRTLTALAGKSPIRTHLNGIPDYTFLWVAGLWEYYQTYGDITFLRQIYPRLQELMEFTEKKTSEDGFYRGDEGDWIFIDWAPMDKTGAVCAEQILLAKAWETYAKISRLIGEDSKGGEEKAKALQKHIFEKFYDQEKRVFIDSYESGKRNVTRHTNIFAYLFLPCTEEQKADIYERVILNDEVRQITTPYFKFYENQVHCIAGNKELLEKSLREYYGGMLKLGATTLYEEYDPSMEGAEHYAMYGHPYQKSLCHAWSASPIYLLGAYRLGVRNTGIAYDSFEVCPERGDLESFEGNIPVPGGKIFVRIDKEKVTVKSDIPGGTLVLGERRIPISAGEELTVEFE